MFLESEFVPIEDDDTDWPAGDDNKNESPVHAELSHCVAFLEAVATHFPTPTKRK